MESVEIVEMAHSRLGASSSHRWFHCPASIPLSDGVKKETSFFAEQGTAAHALAEKCLVEDCHTVKYLDTKIGEFVVDADMADSVQVYLDTVRSYCVGAYDLKVEQKFHLDWIDKEMFGTNDASVVQLFEKVVILDYKHGAGVPVEAHGNEQLLYYALGAIQGYEGYDVECVIVQPRCVHKDGPVRKWKITYKELMEFEKKLTAKVADVRSAEKARNPYQFAHPGEHCKFCPAAGFCKSLREEAMAAVMTDFDAVIPTSPPAPTSLTTEQISKALSLSYLIEEWLSSTRKYAQQMAELGAEIPGFKLVERRTNRKWKSEETVIEEFEEFFGDMMFKKTLLSPAQLEKVIGKEEVKKHTFNPPGGLSLVPVSDKRKAITPATTTSGLELFE